MPVVTRYDRKRTIFSETIDERLRGLERNLTRELEEIKTILYRLLNKRDSFKRASDKNDLRSYEDDHGTARYPRQAEIDAFNNTVHRVPSLNGSIHFTNSNAIMLLTRSEYFALSRRIAIE